MADQAPVPEALPVGLRQPAGDTAGARLIVNLGAVAGNWRALCTRASPARCGAVVKADAYGLGALPVALHLAEAGCRVFFVAHLEEGLVLRPHLPAQATVYVLNGLVPGSETVCAQAGLVPVLNSLPQVAAWQREAQRRASRLPAALQLDTGMHRLGLGPADWQALVEAPDRLAGIALQLVMSHLASAERVQATANRRQLQQFLRMRAAWPDVAASLANSSGILLHPDYHFDLVRPGAALYGIAPQPELPHLMQPVVHLQARILQCRQVPQGAAVGYNGTWRAPRDSRIATVAAGYADGYPRAAGNRAMAAVSGYPVPVVGRVSMDTLTVDVSAVPEQVLAHTTWCDLIDARHDVNTLAGQAGISPYALLTGLGQRFQRVMTGAGAPVAACAGAAPCVA